MFGFGPFELPYFSKIYNFKMRNYATSIFSSYFKALHTRLYWLISVCIFSSGEVRETITTHSFKCFVSSDLVVVAPSHMI